MLHFIEEGDDSFYVTAYNDDGIQIGGYGDGNEGYSRFQSHVTPYQEMGINQVIMSCVLVTMYLLNRFCIPWVVVFIGFNVLLIGSVCACSI